MEQEMIGHIENHRGASRCVARGKGAGRPRLDPERRRTERLDAVRVSPSELAALRERAAAAGLSLSRFVRSAALGLRIRPPMPATDLVVASELGRIGNNLNQLTRLAHSGQLPGWLGGELARLSFVLAAVGARLLSREDR